MVQCNNFPPSAVFFVEESSFAEVKCPPTSRIHRWIASDSRSCFWGFLRLRPVSASLHVPGFFFLRLDVRRVFLDFVCFGSFPLSFQSSVVVVFSPPLHLAYPITPVTCLAAFQDTFWESTLSHHVSFPPAPRSRILTLFFPRND